MCRVGFPLGKLARRCIICIVLVLAGGSFFTGGVLVGHIGSGGRMLVLIGRLLIEIVFLL